VLKPASLLRLWTAAPSLPLERGGVKKIPSCAYPLKRRVLNSFTLPFKGRVRVGMGFNDFPNRRR
jgi:hypothetical protein